MIQQILDEVRNKKIKVVSFDIFDTLILRLAKTPTDIFVKTYERDRNLFPEHIDSDDWKTLRVAMEKTARRRHFEDFDNHEVTLEEIYSYIPEIYENAQAIMSLEIETEICNCYLNPEIYETILKLEEYDCKIVLTSDMYLPLEAIIKLLEAIGIGQLMFDNIFISNVFQKSKRSYGLYEEILKKYTVDPSEVMHIGDNAESDVACAKHLGINTFHYGLISEAQYRHPALYVESFTPFECDRDTYSLRVLTANQNSDFWYQLGALIFAPFYTYFAQWLVWEAKRKGIKRILPIMREGDFLSVFIRNAVRENNMDISVEPLYASRMAVFSSGFDQITKKEVSYLYNTYGIKLTEVFHILNIDGELKRYEGLEEYQINQLRGITLGEESAFNVIRDWLIDPETIDLIRNKNQRSSENAVEYFSGCGLFDGSITVDVGWRGSIQNAIDKLLKDKGIVSNLSHYLCVAKPDVAYNIIPNTDIRGFLGNYGSEGEVTRMVFARLVELSLLSVNGTTLGYQKTNCNTVEPVTLEISYPTWQVEAMMNLQKGLLDFQYNYYRYATQEMKDGIMARKKALGLYGIIDRLTRYPLHYEAVKLKDLQYDQNFGGTDFSKIITDEEIAAIKKIGLEKYYLDIYDDKVTWKSGINVLMDPACCMKSLSLIRNGYKRYSFINIIQDMIDKAERDGKKIVLVGAGANLKTYLRLFYSIGKEGLIQSIWDNSEDKQGAVYFGLEVKAPSDDPADLFICTVENKAIEKILCEQIIGIKGYNIEFRGLGYHYANL